MTARKAAVYENSRTLPEYDSHNISHAGQYTIINVRHPWQGPGTLCSRQAPNPTQRTASRTSFTAAMSYLTFRSLVPARDDGPKGTVYESCRAFPAYDSHIISHAGEYTIINVRHPWQGPGNSCQRQAPNLTQRTASRTSFTTATQYLTFRSLVPARDDGPKGPCMKANKSGDNVFQVQFTFTDHCH